MNIKSENELVRFVSGIDWDDAFIKEAHVASPTYIDEVDDGIVACDSAFSVRVLVCLPKNIDKVIEFKFYDVDQLSFEAQMDILPTANFKHNVIEFRFIGSEGRCIRCRRLEVKCSDSKYSRDRSLYLSQAADET